MLYGDAVMQYTRGQQATGEKREHEATFLSQPELSYTAVTRALAGNLVITVLKFGVYFRTGSAAMLSEAVHTLL